MRSLGACLLACSLALVPRDHRDDQVGEASAVVTLYAHDDLLSSFDFRGGGAGGRLVDGEVHLDRAQIAYGLFAPGLVSFGFSLDERVEVMDLGPVVVRPEARARDRTEEFPISVFHTLFRDHNGFAFVGPGNDVDPFDPADRIMNVVLSPGVRHFEPVIGHTYVLRVRRNGTSKDELFKFLVVDIVAEQSLTIRWARVPGG